MNNQRYLSSALQFVCLKGIKNYLNFYKMLYLDFISMRIFNFKKNPLSVLFILVYVVFLEITASTVQDAAALLEMKAIRYQLVEIEARPLFIGGMNGYWYHLIVDHLSMLDSTAERSLEDIRDIVTRTLTFCPLVRDGEFPSSNCFPERKTPAGFTGAARLSVVCGFSQVLLQERDALTYHANTLFDGPSNLHLKSLALESLCRIEDISERQKLIDLLRKHGVPDNYKVLFVRTFASVPEGTQYEHILQLLPETMGLWNVNYNSDHDVELNYDVSLYDVIQGLAFSSIHQEPLQELVKEVKEFLGKDFGHESVRTFSIFSKIPAPFRSIFIEKARTLLGDSANRSQITSALGCFSSCNTPEELDRFITTIMPIFPQDNNLKDTFFWFWDVSLAKENLENLVRHVLEFGKDPREDNVTDEKLCIKVLQAISRHYSILLHCSRDNRLIEIVRSISEGLTWQHRAELLCLLDFHDTYAKEPIYTISLIKSLSWQGKDNPSFANQLNFFNKISKVFSYGCVPPSSFERMLGYAKESLTPEIIDQQRDVYEVEHYPFPSGCDTVLEQEEIVKAMFESSKYLNLAHTISLAEAQNDAFPLKWDGFVKASLISAIAKIDPSLRELRIAGAHATAKGANTEGQSYIDVFFQALRQ